MNTGFVRPAIAIVPTACGIETTLSLSDAVKIGREYIAIVPTACGIETESTKINGILFNFCQLQ